MEKCPCGSQQTYSNCCAPFLEGRQNAPTAEALMRSRYTAHVKGEIDYIIHTVHPDRRADSDRKTIESWAKEADWKGLEILQRTQGSEKDDVGRVVFKAHYKYQNLLKVHTEDSLFKRVEGKWYFVEGVEPKRIYTKTSKIGRNDPCSCGSGKKFKKCCAKKGGF
ncbi:YchJ family protein [Aureispira sp. CCB-QB1]|nr:YchJ family protein [Aureispira sp. CCB-QB1]